MSTGSVHAFKFGAGKWTDAKLALPAGGSTAVVTANPYSPECTVHLRAISRRRRFMRPTERPRRSRSNRRRRCSTRAASSPSSSGRPRRTCTRVPYFLIHAKAARGPAPTILYSYGGFELSLTPWYWNDGHRPLFPGVPWFSKGGAIAVANIRGGGEFGPAWHQAALKEHRQRAFDDFAAVARDLERRKLTTPAHLGIVGASNGGVLTTVTMTQHPELIGAVVSQRPLVDMLRYTRFGAGASWIAEYGDPAIPAERAYIAKYSAYQNVKPGVRYPTASSSSPRPATTG